MLAQNRHSYNYCKENQKRNDITDLDALTLHLLTNGRKPAYDQTDKQTACLQREVLKCRFYDKGKPHQCYPDSDKKRNQKFHALLEFLEKMRQTVDKPVINSHGNRHGSSTDSGNNICNSHYHTF